MSSVSALAQRLAVVAGFEDPQVGLEQYPTPPDLAAHLIHVADLQGDIEGRPVIDLGTGTGMLALGAALRGPESVVGIDIDPDPLRTARENERRVGTTADVSWIRADATDAPLRSRAASTDTEEVPPHESDTSTTVVMNPPFGAQNDNEHADRAFLATAARVATVSYSVHNANSSEFVEAFADDNGGEVTRAYGAELDLPRQFEFHEADSRTVDAEVFRITWE
ncbi:METTL5 family protein [Halococcus sp. PRR34]|uniref:METTL5 family protein n=1 Tax=Halococcus sp. PRR34 TaxID=3020830 RepID=UPI00236054AB|nr:METTL5 family protein [Halococcus sp. PRR34]